MAWVVSSSQASIVVEGGAWCSDARTQLILGGGIGAESAVGVGWQGY